MIRRAPVLTAGAFSYCQNYLASLEISSQPQSMKAGGLRLYFYLPQALVVWIGSIWLIQWRRWRELLVFGLFGGFMCLFQDHLGHLTGLWTYKDAGPLDTHDEISLLISISAAPTFGLYFAQGLRPGSPFPWQRILAISAVAMIPEVVGVETGNLVYGGWWNVWASIAAHLALWSLFSLLHRVLTASPKA